MKIKIVKVPWEFGHLKKPVNKHFIAYHASFASYSCIPGYFSESYPFSRSSKGNLLHPYNTRVNPKKKMENLEQETWN